MAYVKFDKPSFKSNPKEQADENRNSKRTYQVNAGLR